MQYIIVKFPFSSINDNQYVLAVCLNAPDVSAARAAILADREDFKQEATQLVGGETVYNFTGTLTGNVKAVDDERKDMYDPLVRSKLAFNMAVQTFPAWLFEYCSTNRAKVVVYNVYGGLQHEMWRGYLIGQTLNMTVVRNLLSVSLVAVDEVAMASHMNFNTTLRYVTNDSWCSLYGLMEHFHALHHTRGIDSGVVGFEKIYQILGLTSSNRLLWHRDMLLEDDAGASVGNLPKTLCVNLDNWLQNETATWDDVFDDIFSYLCVTFAVGSYGVMTVNDAYLLTNPTDSPLLQKYIYIFDSTSETTSSSDLYSSMINPRKVGANFQITEEPDIYKEVVVTSKPERWKSHEYLTDDHYNEIDPSKSVRYEWGATDDPDNGPYEKYVWRKLKYCEPDGEESTFLEIAPCTDGEGKTMALLGLLPYDNINSCNGKTKPDASVVESLDFITFKQGVCCIMIGGGQRGGIDEDRLLKRYFLVMNHVWCTMINRSYYIMDDTHFADEPWVTFKPLGSVAALHPSDKHYLRIRMSVMFIRENIPIGSYSDGDPHRWNWFPSPGAGHSMSVVNWSSPAMIMPSDETFFDFADPDGPLHGAYYGGLSHWNVLKFKAYIRIGNIYYNGNSWVRVSSGTPPKCEVTMLNETTKIAEIDKYGYATLETKNYYYTISGPFRGNNTEDRLDNPAMLIDMGALSVHGSNIDGRLEMVILGQIGFISNNPAGKGNSIPFVLIKDVEIGYTDDSGLRNEDLERKVKKQMASGATKEVLTKKLSMASPKGSGFFTNVLLYDGGKNWNNFKKVYTTGSDEITAEQLVADKMADQYYYGQKYVEFETPITFDANVHNINFNVTGLVESVGKFFPVKRTFDYTMETMRVKMIRENKRPAD